MSNPRQRPRLYLRSLRLVGFHNFHDVRIPVSGDLFAVGANESGKTTILDALHLVLTGGQHVDLNAAASVVGRREEGRSVQGIILRADMSGRARKQGGITYAVAELGEVGSSRPPHTLVLGMSAGDMQSRVRRWGMICRTPAAELALTQEEADGRHRIIDDRELAALMGKKPWGRMTDYRRAVAELLLEDPQEYELLLDLWRKAKSYRELSRTARDPAGVIRQVLPAPDRRPFENVARSLADIAEWQTHLDDLAADVSALAGLEDQLHRAREARETSRRYQYVEALQTLSQRREQADTLAKRLEQQTQRQNELKQQVDACRAEFATLDERLAELRGSRGIQLVDRIRDLERRVGEAEQQHNRRQAELEHLEQRVSEQEHALHDARQTLERQLEDARRAVDEHAAALGDPLRETAKHVAKLAAALPGSADTPLDEQRVREAAEVFDADAAERLNAMTEQARTLAEQRDELAEERDKQQRTLDRLRAYEDLVPELPHLDALLATLQDRAIAYRLLYQTIEYADGVDDAEAAAIEDAIGIGRLSTIVVAAEHAEAAQRIADDLGAGLRLLEAEPARDVAQAGEAAQRLLDRIVVQGADRRVEAHLRATLAEMAVLRDPPPEATAYPWRAWRGYGGEPGARWRQEPPTPRWIGADRRRRQRESQIKEIAARLDTINGQIDQVDGERTRLDTARGRLEHARQDLARLQLPWSLKTRYAEAASIERHLTELRPQVEATRDERDQARQNYDAWQQQLDAAKREAAHEHADTLVDQVHRLEQDRHDLNRREVSLNKEDGRLSGEVERLEGELETVEQTIAPAERSLAEAADALLAVLDGVSRDTMDHYVYTEKRAGQIKPENLPKLIQEAQREEAATLARLHGSDGVLRESLARRYGFRVEDRDGRIDILDPKQQSLAALAEQRRRELKQAEDTMGSKTRELFQRVLGHELITQLRDDLTRLRRHRRELNRVLEPLVFGHSRFQLHESVRSEDRRFVELIESASLTNPAAQEELVDYIRDRKEQFDAEGDVPAFLDYRNWFDFSFRLKHVAADETQSVGSEDMIRGSGGAQGTHVYLLLFAMAALLFNRCGARLRLLMLDEAFYGVDPERKEILLRCGKQLDLHFAVATPDLDGTISEDGGDSTTVLVEKDAHDEVEVVPFVWEQHQPQAELFAEQRPSAMIPGTNHDPE